MNNEEKMAQRRSVKHWVFMGLIIWAVISLIHSNDNNIDNTKTITVSGTGDAYAVQDTLDISFTVTKNAADVKTAQNMMNESVNTILKGVKALGVEDKNIKTISYNVYPHYTQTSMPCPANSYCPVQSKPDGFEASQTIEIKLKDISKSGDLVTAIGKGNPTNVSGLQFVVEDDQVVLKEARTKAIDDAKAKAKELSKELGVRLGRVVSFEEAGGMRPGPIYYMKAEAGGTAADTAPSIPTGENKVTSNVTIVYEIR